MASERDFEQLDDYIGNRLSEADKAAFESRLQADPDLQREFKLQQGIINSLRKARAAELKAMLNNIPASSIPTDSTRAFTWTSVAIAALVAIGLYFYLKPSENTSREPVADSVTVVPPTVSQSPETEAAANNEQSAIPADEEKTERTEPNISPENKKESAATPANPGSRGRARYARWCR